MKKKKINSLVLNKKMISNLGAIQVVGGRATSNIELGICETQDINVCYETIGLCDSAGPRCVCSVDVCENHIA